MNNDLTQEILDEMKLEGGLKKIDPLILTLIGEVISQVIVYIINNCILNKKTVNSPNFIQRARLSLLVRRIGRQQGLSQGYRENVFNAMISRGSKATEQDIYQLQGKL